MTNFFDDRDDLPVFIHSELDDLGLSAEAFRAYCHLVRRVGRNEAAFPSYQSIGERCFASDYPNSKITRRKHAISAVKELEKYGLVTIQKRKNSKAENQSNLYRLTPRKNWVGRSTTELGGSPTELGGSPTEPKGTPQESTPQKEKEINQRTLTGGELNILIELTQESECAIAEEFSHFKEDSLTKKKAGARSRTIQQTESTLEEAKDLEIKTPTPQPPSPRLDRPTKKSKTPLDALTEDKDGWLVAPTKGTYKLAGVITLRRMQYAIASTFLSESYEFEFNEDGELEVDFKGETLTWQEFEEDHAIGKLRNIAIHTSAKIGCRDRVTQWWDETIKEFFLESVEFCKKSKDALAVSRSQPASVLFGDIEPDEDDED